jgi:hypothetical protein
MENINFGIVKNIVANTATDAMLNNSINESQEITKNFINVIKESPILMIEFEIYSNIEGKNINSDVLAARYVEKNIDLLKEWNIDEIKTAHEPLKEFMMESNNISNEKKMLYNSINTLITKKDINEEHEAIQNIVNYLKFNVSVEENLNESVKIDENLSSEEVIERAVDLFNEKYQNLTEGEQMVLNLYANNDVEGRIELFKETKEKIKRILEKSEKNKGYDDKIMETIEKIDDMVYEEKTFVRNISKLNALLESLA